MILYFKKFMHTFDWGGLGSLGPPLSTPLGYLAFEEVVFVNAGTSRKLSILLALVGKHFLFETHGIL